MSASAIASISDSTLVRDSLRPYREELIVPLRATLRDRRRSPAARFRAGLALADYDPDGEGWEEGDLAFLAAQLLEAGRDDQRDLRQYLRPVGPRLLGPLEAGGFSPTRLTIHLIPQSAATVFATSSQKQYSLTGSNGTTWSTMDAVSLQETVNVPATGSWIAIASANVDLWTSKAGFNQDVGIKVSGGLFPSAAGQPEAWKESGGFAGTFSPNAAFVQVPLTVVAATA